MGEEFMESVYQIVVYVPESHLEAVKEAMFANGAGQIGDYQSCAWQIQGQGQFQPIQGANPFIGQVGALERVSEYRVEVFCMHRYVSQVLRAMKHAHPYEEPAYFVFQSCHADFE